MEQLNKIIEFFKKLLGLKKNIESQGQKMSLRIMKRTSTALGGSLHGKYANVSENFTTSVDQVVIKKQLYVRRPVGTTIDSIRSKKK